MDQDEFRERSAKLVEIGAVLEKLPEEVRSQAFDLLAEYLTPSAASGSVPKRGKKVASTEDEFRKPSTDPAEFFGSFSHDKPADNAKLVAAYLYAEHGSQPFSVDELKALADSVGITLPARVDMTLIAAISDGKKLFTRSGRGLFKPSVHGELYFKATYKVAKGTKPRSAPPSD